MAAPEGTHAPGGHPRTLSRPSGAGKGHQSHPQDSRRPEDNHTEMASLTCGTAAGDHHKSPPANPAGHSVPRVCVPSAEREGPGGFLMSPSGVSEAAEGQFWAQLYSCTARRGVCPFFGGIR